MSTFASPDCYILLIMFEFRLSNCDFAIMQILCSFSFGLTGQVLDTDSSCTAVLQKKSK